MASARLCITCHRALRAKTEQEEQLQGIEQGTPAPLASQTAISSGKDEACLGICLLEDAEVKGVKSWLPVEIKCQSPMVVLRENSPGASVAAHAFNPCIGRQRRADL